MQSKTVVISVVDLNLLTDKLDELLEENLNLERDKAQLLKELEHTKMSLESQLDVIQTLFDRLNRVEHPNLEIIRHAYDGTRSKTH